MTQQRNVAEQAIEQIALKPKDVETSEGKITSHSISDMIALDKHLTKKGATALHLRNSIQSSVVAPGKNYG